MAKPIPWLLLITLCGALFFLDLGATPLMGLDEALYATSAREMAASGNYVVPTYNGEEFLDKPPLGYWLQALAIRVLGVRSLSVRLPSALAATALVLLTALIGARLHSRRAGLLAGFALATAVYTLPLARLCSLDQLFTLTIAAALGSYVLAHLGIWPKWGYTATWASTGVTLLVKGPAGAVLVVLVIGCYLLIRRLLPSPLFSADEPESKRSPLLARQGPGETLLPHLIGLLLLLLIAAPWYVLVQHETGGAFLKEFIIHQNLQRAMGEDFHHNSPIWFYAPIYLAGFFPWSVFVPLAWKRHVGIRPQGREEAVSLFCAVWLLVVVGVFSLSKSKLPNYIYPAYPPSAILIGLLWWKAREENPALLRRTAAVAFVVAGILGAAVIAGPAFVPKAPAGLSTALIPMGLCLVIGAGLALVFARRGMADASFAALSGGMAGFMLTAACVGAPIAARGDYTAAASLGREIKHRAAPSDTIIAYSLSQQTRSLPFYAERTVVFAYTPSELRAALGSGEATLIITRQERAHDLPPDSTLQKCHRHYRLYRLEPLPVAADPL